MVWRRWPHCMRFVAGLPFTINRQNRKGGEIATQVSWGEVVAEPVITTQILQNFKTSGRKKAGRRIDRLLMVR